MTYREALKKAQEYLLDRKVEEAATDAWILLSEVTGISRTAFLMEPSREIGEEDRKRFEDFLQRRGEREPLQYITGHQNFMGLDFKVSPAVLIPRMDTEVLVEKALERICMGDRVLDLCTGSGCIAISLKKLAGDITVTASDLSEDALKLARENARLNQTEIEFIHSDLFEQITGRYDLIVSNPPYIETQVIQSLQQEVRAHEPFMALDGKEDGLHFYREILRNAGLYLKSGGWILFEIGYDQGDALRELLLQYNFDNIRIDKDLAGLDRVAIGRIR